MTRILKIGTRGSPLALAQAEETKARLIAQAGLEPAQLAITVIKTTGDRILDVALKTAGGKGLFTKEIEVALATGEIDLAVHSMKDVPTADPAGLTIAAILPREDPRDAFMSLRYDSIASLPQGARVGTASLRRTAQLKRLRPDLEIVLLRGTVGTRMAKLEAGEMDATLLAAAGLARLGHADAARGLIDPQLMLPAVAQGAIGIQVRADDDELNRFVRTLNCQESAQRVSAERAFLAGMDGNCETPIAALAHIANGQLELHTEVLLPDGNDAQAAHASGPCTTPAEIGAAAADQILQHADPAFLAALRTAMGSHTPAISQAPTGSSDGT
ncbi:MAG: hydroxymethylbilane synthase [Pseudomonadota bacterium]